MVKCSIFKQALKTDQLNHTLYMRRCLSLARKGLGNTYPNPLVGSVVVYKEKIIGEGWHQQAGKPHAEVNAIQSVQDKSLLKYSTLYVNLEPCVHYGKTPPCTELILKHHIPRVVIANVDPFKKVNGGGISRLRELGVEVILGICEVEGKKLNKRFFCFHKNKRPYIILKWAESADGFLAPLAQDRQQGSPVFLSSHQDQIAVHQVRKQEEAILIGVQTLIDDNPKLTVRWVSGQNPLRIVLDPNARADKEAFLFTDKQANTLHLDYARLELAKNSSWESILKSSLDLLYQKGISSVIVEGGAKTLTEFIHCKLWDEARIFRSSQKLFQGINAPVFENLKINTYRFGLNTLTRTEIVS